MSVTAESGNPRLVRHLTFAFGSIVLVSFAQLLLKIAMVRLPAIATAADVLRLVADKSVTAVLGMIIAGMTCYALSMYLWLRALAGLPLSHAYPLLSISFLLVYAGSVFAPELRESVSPLRLAGIALIVAGNVIAWTEWPRRRPQQPSERRGRRS